MTLRGLGLLFVVLLARTGSNFYNIQPFPQCTHSNTDPAAARVLECFPDTHRELHTCPHGYSRTERRTCVLPADTANTIDASYPSSREERKASFQDPSNCTNGKTCGFSGTCANGTCTCAKPLMAYNGVCATDLNYRYTGYCDETTDERCVFGIDKRFCYGHALCKCKDGRFRPLYIDMCVSDSFEAPNCSDMTNCPPPGTCNNKRNMCSCAPGYFAWGETCVTWYYRTQTACKAELDRGNCDRYSARCHGVHTCVCRSYAIAYGNNCRATKFLMGRYACSVGTGCSEGNGVCAGLGAHKKCYCNPGYVAEQIRGTDQWKCTRGQALQQPMDRSGRVHHHV
ncbi:hypothetical protein BaRGS_00026455 [Batillaria attramentaria]|uniref:EGF-like domain-containing protein n=1 Tax=Batillaria attramentaria TaxID=370345 RepID=A0ABD0K6A9_9CAEN